MEGVVGIVRNCWCGLGPILLLLPSPAPIYRHSRRDLIRGRNDDFERRNSVSHRGIERHRSRHREEIVRGRRAGCHYRPRRKAAGCGQQGNRCPPHPRGRGKGSGRPPQLQGAVSGIRPPRHSGEQRRLRRDQAARRDGPRQLRTGVRHQCHRRHADGTRGRKALRRPEERQHHQHRLDCGRSGRGEGNGSSIFA
jgi:hypothetical protein